MTLVREKKRIPDFEKQFEFLSQIYTGDESGYSSDSATEVSSIITFEWIYDVYIFNISNNRQRMLRMKKKSDWRKNRFAKDLNRYCPQNIVILRLRKHNHHRASVQ